MQVIYVQYECAQCGEKDSDKLFLHETAALAINCWNCHSGRGKDIHTMLATRTGMFPMK